MGNTICQSYKNTHIILQSKILVKGLSIESHYKIMLVTITIFRDNYKFL